MELVEDVHYHMSRLAVECARRLICEDYRRVVRHCSRYGYTLLLTARQFVRLVRVSVLHIYEPQEVHCAVLTLLLLHARIEHGKLDIFEGVCSRDKVEGLEYEAYLLVPDRAELLVVQTAHVGVIEEIRTLGWSVKRAYHIHKRTLSRTRSTDNGNKFTLVYIEVYAVEYL